MGVGRTREPEGPERSGGPERPSFLERSDREECAEGAGEKTWPRRFQRGRQAHRFRPQAGGWPSRERRRRACQPERHRRKRWAAGPAGELSVAAEIKRAVSPGRREAAPGESGRKDGTAIPQGRNPTECVAACLAAPEFGPHKMTATSARRGQGRRRAGSARTDDGMDAATDGRRLRVSRPTPSDRAAAEFGGSRPPARAVRSRP